MFLSNYLLRANDQQYSPCPAPLTQFAPYGLREVINKQIIFANNANSTIKKKLGA